MSPERTWSKLVAHDVHRAAQQLCDEFSTTRDEMLGKSHERCAVAARHFFWRFLFVDKGYSQSEIARWFGVDASTVNTAVNGGKKGKRA